MDGVTMQAKVYRGYAIAAKKIGLPVEQYRPTDALNPLAQVLASMPASFNALDMKYAKPSGYGTPTWYCLADGTQLQVGDYLQGAAGTFFIAAMQPLLPMLAVECNRIISVFRPQQQTGVGALGYGGNTLSNQTAIAAGYPASLLINAKADNGIVKLPGDVRMPWWNLFLPALPGGVAIKNNDVVTDEVGNRYVISAAELTDMGWRITMAESQT